MSFVDHHIDPAISGQTSSDSFPPARRDPARDAVVRGISDTVRLRGHQPIRTSCPNSLSMPGRFGPLYV